MSRSRTHAFRNTAKDSNIEFHGIPQVQKGYYVDTAGKNASQIEEYIKNQLKEDELGEQLTFGEKAPLKNKFYFN